MASLLNTSVTGNVTVTLNVSSANLFVGGTQVINTAANDVNVYANSESLQTAVGLNFINTSSMTVTVAAGSTGNANISFTASAGTKTPLVVTPSTNQDNYNPAGLADTGELRFNHTADIKLTGLAAQSDGFRIVINNTTTDYLLWLENENTSSTAANRFDLPDGFPAFLMPGDTITLSYDTTISRWRVAAWPTKGPAMGLSYFDDFIVNRPLAPSLTTATRLLGFFSSGGTGSGYLSTYAANTTEKPFGVTGYNLGSSNTNIRWAFGGPSGGRMLIGNNNPVLSVARVALPNTPQTNQDYIFCTGFLGDSTTPASGRGANWVYRSSSGTITLYQEIRATNASAGVINTNSVAVGWSYQSTTNSPAVDANYLWLVVYVNGTASRVSYIYSTDSVSFTLASTLSPTDLVGGIYGWNPAFAQASGSTVADGTLSLTARQIYMDLAGCRISGYVRG